MKERIQYNYLADLFRYPNDGYKERVNACYEYLQKNYPLASIKLEPFVKYVNEHTDFEVEEIFGKTFHIQAICYLDIGYVLFAEDYKRGEFLVQMKKEQEKINNDCGEELADNLPNVLVFMAKMQDEEFLKEFGVRIMKPALSKMMQEFEESRMELKEKVRKKKQKVVLMEDVDFKNIYQYAIESLETVVVEDFKHVSEYNDPEIVPTLGGTVGTVLSGNCDSGCATPRPLTEKTN